MNSTIIDYTSFLRTLAAKHVDLKHTAEEKHFFRGELEEFFQQFRSDVCFPCLIAEGSDVSYSGNEHNIVKDRTTSFIVADRYDQHDDYDEIELKWSKCERIAEEIMGAIISDESSPFVSVDISEGIGKYLQNTQHRYVGYRMDFTFKDTACFYNPKKFVDVSEVAEETSSETTNSETTDEEN